MSYPFNQRSNIKRTNKFQRLKLPIMLSGIACTLLTIFYLHSLRERLYWKPLQRYYWGQYFHATFQNHLQDSSVYTWAEMNRLGANNKPETRAALDGDVIFDDTDLTLSPEAIADGWKGSIEHGQLKDNYFR